MSLRVLILGGTTEALALARALSGDTRFVACMSLAGRTRTPVLSALPTRIGGFGGADGLARFMREGRYDVLVDATHPFATRISGNAMLASHMAGVPLLGLRRPAWTQGPGDQWITVPDMAAAAQALGTVRQTVLLTIGRQDLHPFRAAPWHDYVVRSVDAPPPDLLPMARIITARGPFTLADERALLRDLGMTILVTKNSGGHDAKLAAARELGITVVMVARPVAPHPDDAPMTLVADAAGALAWLQAHAQGASRRGV